MAKEEMKQTLTIRPCTAMEADYAFSQPAPIRMFSGGMGYIRGDFDTNGNAFFTRSFLTEEGFTTPVLTPEVTDAINETINALRLNPETGMPLRDRVSMKRYQRSHPGYDLGQGAPDYKDTAIRIDNSKNLTIILRLKPRTGDYDFYAHCFNTRALDRMIEGRTRGIYLKTPATEKHLVHLNDGDSLRIVSKKGDIEEEIMPVYLDKDHYFAYGHTSSGSTDETYHHHMELATLPFMEGNEKSLIPVRKALPKMCYGVDPETNRVIRIEKARTGYTVLEGRYESYEDASHAADEMNKMLPDVMHPADRQMMEAGLFKGWAHPDADPSSYTEEKPVQEIPGYEVEISKKERHTDYDVPFEDHEVEVEPFKYRSPFSMSADESGYVTEWAARDRSGNAVAFGTSMEECADAAEKMGYKPCTGFINDFYVIEGSEKKMFPVSEITRYKTLPEAVTHFREIPESKNKLIGIDRNRKKEEKFGGGTDLIAHVPGKGNTAISDWKIDGYGPGWNNAEVRSTYNAICREFGIKDVPKKKPKRKNVR